MTIAYFTRRRKEENSFVQNIFCHIFLTFSDQPKKFADIFEIFDGKDLRYFLRGRLGSACSIDIQNTLKLVHALLIHVHCTVYRRVFTFQSPGLRNSLVLKLSRKKRLFVQAFKILFKWMTGAFCSSFSFNLQEQESHFISYTYFMNACSYIAVNIIQLIPLRIHLFYFSTLVK